MGGFVLGGFFGTGFSGLVFSGQVFWAWGFSGLVFVRGWFVLGFCRLGRGWSIGFRRESLLVQDIGCQPIDIFYCT